MKKIYELESVSCPLCGSNNADVILTDAKEMYIGLDEHFSVKKCRSCEMVWTDPRPTPSTISYFYPDTAGYYSPEKAVDSILTGQSPTFVHILKSNLGYVDLADSQFSSNYWFQSRYLVRKAKLLHIPNWIPNGKLLDVGCSWGRYLKQMCQLGWDVYGVEFNAASVKHAQEKLGLSNVRKGQMENHQYPSETFDVVHLSMVLEHLHQPRRALNELATALKPGGQLIVSVPDFSGLEFSIFGRYCYALHLPQHLNHFSPQTLTKILEETGFRVESITHQAVDRDFIASLGYTKKYNSLLKLVSKPYIRKYLLKPVVFAFALMGLTSRMSIYARKV
jgi:2-polyprenyl-3-methyl-5-hydroxy-6-metoxy-1,4-benzoquinol methylase